MRFVVPINQISHFKNYESVILIQPKHFMILLATALQVNLDFNFEAQAVALPDLRKRWLNLRI